MDLYLRFVEERHNVWVERQIGAPAPWTSDPVLAGKKFTNVFRILDPGSQFILTDLAQGGTPEDFLMRCFLYRHTGKIDSWKHLEVEFGGYPGIGDLDDIWACWQEYRGAFDGAERKPGGINPQGGGIARSSERTMFTKAYLVFPQSQERGTDKLHSIIQLAKRLFEGGSVARDFLQASTQAERFAALKINKGVGDFMSMQILTDWGYGPYAEGDFENDFVVPGPGCRKGISCITDTPDQVAFLHFAREEVLAGDDVPMLSFENGSYRVPSIMDVQNTMCEFSKYVRYLEKGVNGSPYTPAHPGPQPTPVLPSHWA